MQIGKAKFYPYIEGLDGIVDKWFASMKTPPPKKVYCNSDKYIIEQTHQQKMHLIIKIKYEELSYIVLYNDMTLKKLLKYNKNVIEPAFNNTKLINPICIFEPTEYGWNAAIQLANIL